MQSYLLTFAPALLCALVASLVIWRRSPRGAVAAGIGVFILVVGVLLLSQSRERPNDAPAQAKTESAQSSPGFEQFESMRPAAVTSGGYVGSAACADCHPHNHATWSASYHRTMTQAATPEAVIGDFGEVQVAARGRSYRLSRRADVFWAEMDDPDSTGGAPARIERPIVLTTGSHHMQVYWYAVGDSRVVGQLPLAYLKDEQRWIGRDSAFLMQPDAPFGSETARWNETCSGCHTTFPRARPDGAGGWDTLVGEFGISCEACHGPGSEHVQMRRGGGPDAAIKIAGGEADAIVNPAALAHRQSSQVCGQCHGITILMKYRTALTQGRPFRPGGELSGDVTVVRCDDQTRPLLEQLYGERTDEYLRESFWTDGMVRVSGREYNGLIESACFQRGEMSCLSCHQMHLPADDPRPAAEWADDQLAAGMRSDRACLQCHQADRYGAGHTHHAAESAGAQCYNCHMPHATYGLLKAIRSHQISSPDLRADLAAGRPNACNLCHLDQTLAWTSRHLAEWYGASAPELDADQSKVAAALLWALRGDAGQRALAAWSMSWSPALEASGDDWQAPFLAALLDDPYDAVRYIAGRSLRDLLGFDEFNYDFVGEPAERQAARDRALILWSQQPGRRQMNRPQLLIDGQGELQTEAVDRLLKQRDDRAVNLAE